jgi:ubiquinone/menaquinone biosynthesis C-methylase UbiE
LEELHAVLSPFTSEKRNAFLHSTQLAAANIALELNRGKIDPVIVDFGCGNGRWVRFFGRRGASVTGLDITPEMLSAARRIGIPEGCSLIETDGVNIPFPDRSVDMVWVCGVLRFSLFVPNPVYRDIADEMYRVLKPGGYVVNIEMYVDNPPGAFTSDFEDAGFVTKEMRIVQRYSGRFENYCLSPRWPLSLVKLGGKLCATWRLRFDSAAKNTPGLRDYLFVWAK